MGNLMASFNTGVSGLHSAQTSLNTTAHNIANTSTKGYVRQQALVTDYSYMRAFGSSGVRMQIGLGTNITGIRQIRNTFLDERYRLQFGRQSFYETQQSTFQEVENLFGELEGEQFSNAIKELKNSMEELAKYPGEIAYKDMFVSTSTSMVEKVQVLKSQLDAYQVSMNTEIISQVNRINEITDGIDELNRKIQRYEIDDKDANDFRDHRHLLLDELSKYTNFEVTEESDGVITVYTGGNYLVASNGKNDLSVAKINDSTEMLKVVWEKTKGDFFLTGDDLSYSTEKNTDVGSLRAIMIARGNKLAKYTDVPVRPDKKDFTDSANVLDETAYIKAMNQFEKDTAIYNEKIEPSIVMKTQAELDVMIHHLVTTINDILCPNIEVELDDGSKIKILDTKNAPIGNDANKTMGVELFSRRSVERYTMSEVMINGSLTEVYVYNEEDPSDPFSLYSINQLVMNSEVVKNPSLLPINSNPDNGYADGYEYKVAKEMLSAWDNDTIALNPNNLTTYSLSDYYNAMIAEQATLGQVWNSVVTHQTMLSQGIDNERQSVMGVSSDEEMASLIKFQHCYNASSRYITAVDEMLKHIIERLG